MTTTHDTTTPALTGALARAAAHFGRVARTLPGNVDAPIAAAWDDMEAAATTFCAHLGIEGEDVRREIIAALAQVGGAAYVEGKKARDA